MPWSWRLPGRGPVLAVLVVWGTILPVTVSARLPEALHSFAIRYVEAIHYPTGCIAVLEYNRDTLLGAVIVDPDCLPEGVIARSIPAFEHDFHLLDERPEVFISR